jgi:hypothetical protein
MPARWVQTWVRPTHIPAVDWRRAGVGKMRHGIPPFETDDDEGAAAQEVAHRQQQAVAPIMASGMDVGAAQQQPLLKLVRVLDQPLTEVLLIYAHPSQTLLVSISRTDLTAIADQALSPSDQNFLVEKNLAMLEPVIEGKRARGETTMRTDPRTGRTTGLIELRREDLEQGLRWPPTGGATLAGEGVLNAGAFPQPQPAAAFGIRGSLVAGGGPFGSSPIGASPIDAGGGRLAQGTPPSEALQSTDSNALLSEDGKVLITEDGKVLITEDGKVLITEDGKVRVTEDGKVRVTEDGKPLLSNSPPISGSAIGGVGATQDYQLSTIGDNHQSLLALSLSLEHMARQEIDKLRAERPNDPTTAERTNEQIELLTILADGFAQIAVALGDIGDNPDQPLLRGKARDAVNALGEQFQAWWNSNAADATDWALRGSFMVAVIGALGWAGADMRWATPGILAMVGGEKVAKVFAGRKGTTRRRRS